MIPDNRDREDVLVLDDVRKAYGRHVAVGGVDLRLRPEEFLTFLGPSGSGKTTTLMMVAGLQQPDSGSIVLAGRSVAHVPAHRRDIGMVFQHYALFPHMNVRRNVAFPLEMRRIAAASIRARVDDVLALVGLAEYGDRFPRQLSGGQQQRVALARALVYEPALLLMDEPLGALDKKLREQLQREIRRVHRDRRTSILYVTHDQEEALTMSDRIAVFNGGVIEQVGTPLELYERPATRFVADFVGETNFFPATIRGGASGRATLDLRGATLEAGTIPDGIGPGSHVAVAVRPERLVLVPFGDGIPGRIVEVVYLGNARRVVVRNDDGSDCVVLQSATAFEAGSVEPGAPVAVTWKPEHATAFAA